MFLAVPDMIGWVITAIATNTSLLQSARFILGMAGGGYLLCVQVYVGEICSCYHRGWLLSLTSPITALGVLTMYVTSGILPWHCTAAACCPVPALLVVMIMFYWDSPYWSDPGRIGRRENNVQGIILKNYVKKCFYVFQFPPPSYSPW